MEEITEARAKLYEALAKAQGEIKPLKKDTENPFFKQKYVTLDAIAEAAFPILSKNGLSVTQVPAVDGTSKTLFLYTRLLHKDGGVIEGTWPIGPLDMKQQALGSATTYARRYSLMSMLGFTAEDEDDDGNGASKPEAPRTSEPRKTPAIPTTKNRPNANQLKKLFATAGAGNWTHEDIKSYIKAKFMKDSTKDLTEEEFQKTLGFFSDKKSAGEP